MLTKNWSDFKEEHFSDLTQKHQSICLNRSTVWFEMDSAVIQMDMDSHMAARQGYITW